MTARTPTAYKGIVLIKRREGMSREEYLEWFCGPHAQYSLRQAGVFRYTASLIVAPGPRHDFVDGEPSWDIVSEIWCKDRETLEAVFANNAASGGPLNTLAASSRREAFIAEEYTLKG